MSVEGVNGSGMNTLFNQIDANRDNSISSQELFKFADTDGDGALSKEELSALAEKFQKALAGAEEEQSAQEQAPAGGGGGGSAPAAAPGGPSFNELFSLLDQDGDGKISPEELAEFMKKADANGDGKLSEGELKDAATQATNTAQAGTGAMSAQAGAAAYGSGK